MKLIYYPDFLESIAEQAGYLAQEADVQLADRFIEAVKDTTEQIQMMPFLGFNREFNNNKLKNVRVWRVKGFEKYLIFYVPQKEIIEFVYLIHSARDYTKLFDEE
jgi:toxin ParE1/3/4